MKAYRNEPAIKAKYVARFAQHRAADAVIQGTGYRNGHGCFVGCTLEKYDHSQFPIELGWPEWLAQLADTIFEGLPALEAPKFGTDLLDAVPVGADLEAVRVPFLLSLQRRNLERLADNDAPYAQQCRNAIRRVIDWFESGVSEAQRESAESAAWSARWSAEEAAELTGWTMLAISAVELAAESAALSIRSSVTSATVQLGMLPSEARLVSQSAGSSTMSAVMLAESAAHDVRSAAWHETKAQRDTLLELISGL